MTENVTRSIPTAALTAALLIGFAGCTSAGAPPPGDRGPQDCMVGEQRVCTGATGSRLPQKTDRDVQTCTCEPINNVQQF